MSIKLSVIIPVYNVEDKIGVCLDSLRAQTMDNIEVILVDDHGGDDSIKRARDYASSNPQMKFVFVDNGANLGPGRARNKGLQYASGEFVAFVDSDDWVSSDFCESLYDAAVEHNAQMAYCHVNFDYPEGKEVINRNPMVPAGEFCRRPFLRKYKSYFFTFIYDRQFLLDNNILFPDTHCAEDSCFLLCSLLACRRIANTDKAMYHYIVEPSSLSHRKDKTRWKNRLKSFRTVRRYAREHNLYRDNMLMIEWLCFKKGLLLALKDIVSNI